MKFISVSSITFSFFLLASIALTSCGQNTDSSASNSNSTESTETGDPVEQLKVIINESKSNIEGEGVFNPGDDVGERLITNIKVVDTNYDVQKSDSLVTPYLGFVNNTINYNLEISSKSTNSLNQVQCKTTYAYQDGDWIIKGQEYYLENLANMGWKIFDGQEKSVPSIVCGFTE